MKPFEGGCQLGTVGSPSQLGSFGAMMKDLRIKEYQEKKLNKHRIQFPQHHINEVNLT